MKTAKLWTRNFRLVILASAMGTIGAIAGSFALAFLVFDETGSTLASALIVAIQLLPYLLLPVLIAPLMDRLPRKAFLVAGDLANAALLAGMGLWLMAFDFSYVGYLALSLLLACRFLIGGRRQDIRMVYEAGCAHRAPALCAVFVFGSWIDISKGLSARQSLFISGFIRIRS